MMFHVTLEPAEDGWIVAECPAFPGCVSQGRDEKEALENVREAITAWMWAEDQKAARKSRIGRSALMYALAPARPKDASLPCHESHPNS
jgi:predicted RNase H-like HicB family nuclease